MAANDIVSPGALLECILCAVGENTAHIHAQSKPPSHRTTSAGDFKQAYQSESMLCYKIFFIIEQVRLEYFNSNFLGSNFKPFFKQ